MENTVTPEKPLLTNKTVSILSIILLIIVIVLSGVLFSVLNNKNSTQTQQTAQTTNNTKQENETQQTNQNLAAGQTNPNIVGYGQTFKCEPRSDEEYYRTDKTLVIDPNNTQTMYVSVEYKGFHKTTDGGQTWTLLDNGIKSYGSEGNPNKPCYGEYPYALIDPTNSNRVILATSGAGGTIKDVNALSAGIFESLDGGVTFTQIINDDMNGYVSSITFDPNNPQVLYYGSNSSPASYLEADPNKIFVKEGLVYKYNGTEWSELKTGFFPYTGATGVHVNPANSNEIVVFTMSAPKPQGGQRSWEGVEQMGVLRSTDGGATWNTTHPLPTGYDAVLVHAVSKDFKNMFVSPFMTGSGSPKSLYSTDSGLTFKESSRFMDFIAFDPHNSNRLLGYAWQGSSGPVINSLFESTDAGATWHEFGTLPAEITNIGDKKTLISNIVWDPVNASTIYMSGASGLVWRSTNNGGAWTKLLDYTRI